MHIGGGENDDAMEIELQFWSPLSRELAESLMTRLAHRDEVLSLHLPK